MSLDISRMVTHQQYNKERIKTFYTIFNWQWKISDGNDTIKDWKKGVANVGMMMIQHILCYLIYRLTFKSGWLWSKHVSFMFIRWEKKQYLCNMIFCDKTKGDNVACCVVSFKVNFCPCYIKRCYLTNFMISLHWHSFLVLKNVADLVRNLSKQTSLLYTFCCWWFSMNQRGLR